MIKIAPRNYVTLPNAPDLTMRQLAIMDLVANDPGPHTVRGVARQLGIVRPVVTRALNTLGELGFLMRAPDPDDGRSLYILMTADGREFLEKVAA